MALTAAVALPVPFAVMPVGVPFPAGIKSEVAAEVSLELPVETVEAEAEDGLANLAHAFFHLHWVHQRSRCSNP